MRSLSREMIDLTGDNDDELKNRGDGKLSGVLSCQTMEIPSHVSVSHMGCSGMVSFDIANRFVLDSLIC